MIKAVKKTWSSLKNELKDKWEQLIGNECNENSKLEKSNSIHESKKIRKKRVHSVHHE